VLGDVHLSEHLEAAHDGGGNRRRSRRRFVHDAVDAEPDAQAVLCRSMWMSDARSFRAWRMSRLTYGRWCVFDDGLQRLELEARVPPLTDCLGGCLVGGELPPP